MVMRPPLPYSSGRDKIPKLVQGARVTLPMEDNSMSGADRLLGAKLRIS